MVANKRFGSALTRPCSGVNLRWNNTSFLISWLMGLSWVKFTEALLITCVSRWQIADERKEEREGWGRKIPYKPFSTILAAGKGYKTPEQPISQASASHKSSPHPPSFFSPLSFSSFGRQVKKAARESTTSRHFTSDLHWWFNRCGFLIGF